VSRVSKRHVVAGNNHKRSFVLCNRLDIACFSTVGTELLCRVVRSSVSCLEKVWVQISSEAIAIMTDICRVFFSPSKEMLYLILWSRFFPEKLVVA
jgi:hypothetical protein